MKQRLKRSVFEDNYFDHEYKVPIKTFSRTRTIFKKAQPVGETSSDRKRFVLERLINDADREATEQYMTRHIPKSITTNTCKVDAEHFKKFQNKFLTKKKNLEINVLRDNKR